MNEFTSLSLPPSGRRPESSTRVLTDRTKQSVSNVSSDRRLLNLKTRSNTTHNLRTRQEGQRWQQATRQRQAWGKGRTESLLTVAKDDGAIDDYEKDP